jgi:CRP/FNR family transcriptional regulator
MADRQAAIISITSIKAACQTCSLKELCLPLGLDATDLNALDRLIRRRHRLKKGQFLYRLGDPLRALYAIREGSMKTTGLMEDGRVQVTGFHLPGELLGIDAISNDKHPCSAEALEPTDICEIPYQALEGLALKVPGLQHQLLRLMSREIARDQQMLMTLGRMAAEERVASCLLSFSQRHERLGRDATHFRLSMSRQDLGDYLGLALETVSRLLSRLHEEGLIEVSGRHITIRNPGGLKTLGGACDMERSANG